MTDDQQNPLENLEQALNQEKVAQAEPEVDADQQRVELDRLVAEQKEEDAEALRQQIADFQDVAANSPQEQIRKEQRQAEEQEKQAEEEAKDGFEIRQLDHTKINQ